jgi:hypothetical protein
MDAGLQMPFVFPRVHAISKPSAVDMTSYKYSPGDVRNIDDSGCGGFHGLVFKILFLIELVNHCQQISSQFFPDHQDNPGRNPFAMGLCNATGDVCHGDSGSINFSGRFQNKGLNYITR